MKTNRIWSIFRIIALVILIGAEAFAVTVILQLNMLPEKYFAIMLAVLVVLTVYTALLLFWNGKKKVKIFLRIVACIMVLVMLLGCVLVSKIAWDAHNFMDNVTGGDDLPSTRNSYVLVRNEDAAQSLKDTKGYRYGAVENYDVEHTEQMLGVIQQETGEAVALTEYKQAALMVDALYNKQADALIMNGASISLLIEQPAYEDFLDRARILYTLPYEDTTQKEENKPNNEKVEAGSPFVVYISGSDTRSQKLYVSRSDVNILAVVHPQTKQVLLLNTPRDYYVPNPAGKGALDKLTHCGNYGVDCSVKALEDLYNVDITHSCQINFSGFEKMIDAIGGITIYSETSFYTVEGYIQKGENHLNGVRALSFARERYNLSGGDNARGKNQMKVIKAVIDKMTSSTTLISKYAEILKSLEGMFATSFQSEEISELVKMQLTDMAKWNVQSFAVTGTGGYGETYSAPGEELYIMHPNEATVEYASGLIQRVLKGETLTAEDMKMP